MKSITPFHSNMFYKTQNNFGLLNDHIITEFSWVVTMAPTVFSTDILRYVITHVYSHYFSWETPHDNLIGGHYLDEAK